MSAPEIHCTECGWEGAMDDMVAGPPADPAACRCPGCDRLAENCMSEGSVENCCVCRAAFVPETTAPNLIDAALSASSAIDRTAPQRDMRVPSWEEREAERKRVAERIASMWEALS